MPMQIKQKAYLAFSLDIMNQILHMSYLRKELLVLLVEMAVEVLSQYSSSVVAEEHSIWIHHRHNSKVELLFYTWVLNYRLDEPFQSKIRYSFPRVCPSQHHNPLSLMLPILHYLHIRYLQP